MIRLPWRREKPKFKSRTVIELFKGDEPVLRIDLPTVIEEDDDGRYPMVQAHSRKYEPMEIDGLQVTMRHRQIDG